MKIYDCFTFFNELDLLEIRLSELYPYVDYFVISEGNRTHSNKKKEYLFEKNKFRFKNWEKKIIYIKAEMPKLNFFDILLIFLERFTHGFGTRFLGSNFRMGKWKLENFQREELKRGLKKCNSEDIIMVSDLDEIPNPDKFSEMKRELENHIKVGFKQKMFNKYLNGYLGYDWVGTKATKYHILKDEMNGDPQIIRLRKYHFILNRLHIAEKIKLIKNGGWHFNNVGKKEEVLKKIESKAEADLASCKRMDENRKNFNSNDSLGIISSQRLKILKIDSSFPKEIQKNQDKYRELISPC